jgi:triphosphoribosyl-dephospho-CoA synthase
MGALPSVPAPATTPPQERGAARRNRAALAPLPPTRPPDPARLADDAVASLVDEALLTPKPGLVDRRGSGAHADLDLDVMLRSATSLHDTFAAIARRAAGARLDERLREDLAALGREGERAMLAATGGSNAHRGAIWSVGLLVAGAALDSARPGPRAVASRAAAIARYPDRFAPDRTTNGARACARYGVAGARGEARSGFPHVVSVGLPALRRARLQGAPEECARLDALLAIMSSLEDTCLLHRGGPPALEAARRGARCVLEAGGASTRRGRRALLRLDAVLLTRNASPGGSADCLAAVLFLDRLAGPGATHRSAPERR